MKQIIDKSLTAGPIVYRNEEQKAQHRECIRKKRQVFVEKTTSLNHSKKQGDNNKVITTAILVTELKRWETGSV